MIKLAICDDDHFTCDQLESILKKSSKQLDATFEIEVFHYGESLLHSISNGERYDFIFLDIILSDVKGTDAAVRIRKELNEQIVKIVFVSSSHEYGPEVVNAHPLKYLVKPIKYDEVYQALEEGIGVITKERKQFTFKSGKKNKKYHLNDILYFEARNKQIRMMTSQGEETFYGTISSIEKNKLHGFILVHRSYLVNFFNIASYSHDDIIVRNGDLIHIGTTRKDEVAANILRLAGEYSVGI